MHSSIRDTPRHLRYGNSEGKDGSATDSRRCTQIRSTKTGEARWSPRSCDQGKKAGEFEGDILRYREDAIPAGLTSKQAGVPVGKVRPNSAASKAGLLFGDVITPFEDKPVKDWDGFLVLMETWNAGDEPRLTNAHSKKNRNHDAMLGLYFAWHHLCRKHSMIKTTPAVMASLTDSVWATEKLLAVASAV